PELRTGLLKGKKIEKKLEEVFGNTNIEDTKIPLKIVATNIETSESQVFSSGKIVTALRASMSLPGIFIPQKIDGESYVDGGIMMNLPIEVLDGKNIIAISALKINQGPIEKTKKIIGINFKSGFFKNNYEIIKRSVILMMKVNEDNSLKTPNKNITFIRPDFGKLDIIDFNKVDEFVEIGYKDAKKLEL
ncbi:patatin-like phospholipase family protein, partial [Candidatus Gracilibacteria bacterium]|nr:patatin-like phospholipase family protein [Candidatus Gracilibacteria bacterium]